MDAVDWVNTTATHGLAFVFLSVTALGIASVFITLAWLLIRLMKCTPDAIHDWLRSDAAMRQEITESWREIRTTLHDIREGTKAIEITAKRTHNALRHTVHAAKHIVHSLIPEKAADGGQASEQLRQAEEHLG
jgi:hypothetical protein